MGSDTGTGTDRRRRRIMLRFSRPLTGSFSVVLPTFMARDSMSCIMRLALALVLCLPCKASGCPRVRSSKVNTHSKAEGASSPRRRFRPSL